MAAMMRSMVRGERGQALILGVLGVTVILVIAVIAIQFGLWLSERRGLQRAADLAALAGAYELPADDVAASASALDWAARNGYTDGVDGVTVTTEILCKGGATCTNPGGPEPAPCSGPGCDSIRVVIKKPADMLFGDIFGLGLFDIEAGASATLIEVPALVAIWADNSSCSASDPLKISGSDITVNGTTHSNSKIEISGQDNDFEGNVEYACSIISHSSSDFDSPPVQVPPEPPPVEYAYSDFPCTREFTEDTDLWSDSSIWLSRDDAAPVLAPGVYCSTQNLTLSKQNTSGNVTLVAKGKLDVGGSDFNLTGYYRNVLLFSSACATCNPSAEPAIQAGGSGGSWLGLINAPNGLAKISGGETSAGNRATFGSTVANRVDISGSNFEITATELDGEGFRLRLVE